MKLSLIAAMTRDRVIGKDNEMPWHLPADFKWFKQCTMGKPIIMGRKTYESIGRPLPGRTNIVVSRDPELKIENVKTFTSIDDAIRSVSEAEEILIIGGDSIYTQTLKRADRLYVTIIDTGLEGDAFFPDYDLKDWNITHREMHYADDKNAYDMKFLILDK
ncbi:dihydrofolate reductase [Vibrio coralliirubri]|uniref:type 3 dihydrofolate reductase n=1 Tax=Vibrio coralliirubri TaxID=1516159 RepID=UPI000634C3E7|nr:type 3 dihydrofolate reductase [Vibrio coralliirubri]CDT53112.1 dihydrofolate reductase [Vibrio coralliirubri]